MKKKACLSVLLLTALLLCVAVSCGKQKEALSCRSFTVYDVKAPARKLTAEELSEYLDGVTYREATPRQCSCIASAARCEELVLWKGSKFGIFTTEEGEQQQIRISLYGGFFSLLDENEHPQREGQAQIGEYYSIDESRLADWNELIDVS